MDGTIGRFHTDYVFFGRSDAAAVTRLNSVRDRLSGFISGALDAVLGDDPAVYVIRRLRLRFMLNLEQTDDVQLTQAWTNQLVYAVMRLLAKQECVGYSGIRADETVSLAGEMVRFEDQATFVTQFVVDLMRGEAWDRWYYSAFSAYRPQPPGDALLGVLLENAAQLPAILVLLHREKQLDALFWHLGERVTTLWRTAFAEQAGLAPEALLPLAQSTIILLESLRLWRQAPDAAVLTASYAGVVPDWNDTRSLAAAVLEMVHIARRQGWLRAANAVHSDWDTAIQAFDWLDTAWLRERLPHLLAAAPEPAAAYPLRDADVLTPRARRLLDDLLSAPDLDVDLNQTNESSALRLLAALIAYRPEWEGDALALILIRRVLAIRESLRAASVPLRQLECLMRGTETLFSISPTFVVAAAPLLRRLLAAMPSVAESDGEEITCGGLFLLIRILQDTRVVPLAQRLSFPNDSPLPLLAALAWRWAGIDESAFNDTDDDSVKTGIEVFMGTDVALSPSDWCEAWEAVSDPADFEAEMRRVFAAQRLLDDVDGWTPDVASLSALAFGRVGVPSVDDVLDRVAALLLVGWSRWLRGFEASSAAFLLEQFVRRRGWLRLEEETVWVTLERAPLDIVLEMSGYTSDIERISWLDGKRVKFRIRERDE